MHIILPLLFSALAFLQQDTQEVNTEASMISFEVDPAMGSTDGTFQGPQGEVFFNTANPTESFFDVKVDASTIDTGIKLRDNHLKSDDFFHVEKYPFISFESSDIEKQGGGYVTTGTLQIKNIKKEVQIPFEVIHDKNHVELKGQFTVNREDFELGTNFGKFFIGKTVDVTITAQIKYN